MNSQQQQQPQPQQPQEQQGGAGPSSYAAAANSPGRTAGNPMPRPTPMPSSYQAASRKPPVIRHNQPQRGTDGSPRNSPSRHTAQPSGGKRQGYDGQGSKPPPTVLHHRENKTQRRTAEDDCPPGFVRVGPGGRPVKPSSGPAGGIRQQHRMDEGRDRYKG